MLAVPCWYETLLSFALVLRDRNSPGGTNQVGSYSQFEAVCLKLSCRCNRKRQDTDPDLYTGDGSLATAERESTLERSLYQCFCFLVYDRGV